MGTNMPMPMPPMPMPMPTMPMPMPPMPMPGMAPSSMANNSDMNMDMDMGMHTSFFWGKDVVILFQGWPNDHLGMYILALIFVFLLSFSLEILSLILINPSSSSSSNSKPRSPVVGGLIHAVVYGIKMALAYMVMLSVMTFNIGVFLVAVIGHASGGFLVKYLSLVNQKQQQGVATPTEPLLPLSKPLQEA